MNVLFDKLMGLCYGLFPMHDVMVCIFVGSMYFSYVACCKCFALFKSSWWN